jgi:hypothetical protein
MHHRARQRRVNGADLVLKILIQAYYMDNQYQYEEKKHEMKQHKTSRGPSAAMVFATSS